MTDYQYTTDHSYEIDILRAHRSIQTALAADLLELHDKTGISLDNWENANAFVSQQVRLATANRDFKISPNGV